MKTKQLKNMAVLLAASAIPGLCGEGNEWASVENLRRGVRIGVVQADQKRVEGKFTSADGSTLKLDQISIDRNNVYRVYKIGMSRKKRMLIGAATGLAAGAAIAGSLSHGLNGEGRFSGGAGAAGAVAGGAGIGIAIGGLTGSGYQTIYQREGGR